MICKKCGCRVSDTAAFCDKCGAPMAEFGEKENAVIAEKKQDFSFEKGLDEKCAILALGAIACIVLLFVVFSGNKKVNCAAKVALEIQKSEPYMRVLEAWVDDTGGTASAGNYVAKVYIKSTDYEEYIATVFSDGDVSEPETSWLFYKNHDYFYANWSDADEYFRKNVDDICSNGEQVDASRVNAKIK